MADDFGEKTEAPTPRRRIEAREQGNIARSPDLTAAVIIIAAMLMLNWYGDGVVRALRVLMTDMLGNHWVSESGTDGIGAMLFRAVSMIALAMAPLVIGIMLAGVIVNIIQVGFFFSPKRLQPRITALNPFKGLGRLFGRGNGLMSLVMNLLKLVLVALVAWSAIGGRIEQILHVQQLDFLQIFALTGAIVYTIVIRIGLLLLVLAIIDYAYQRWRNERQLRMTKQEVKDEMRRMEGDPQIKQRRRQIALQRTMQRIRKDVPTSDVVVTNPTEFAVAIKYDAETMTAPRVVAKGQGYIAQMIRQIAIENGIPILERKPLARALYKLVEVGQEIPEEFYSAVAEILAYVYELSGKLRQRQQA
jgi:flagellar biosynthetic protein FlhB